MKVLLKEIVSGCNFDFQSFVFGNQRNILPDVFLKIDLKPCYLCYK